MKLEDHSEVLSSSSSPPPNNHPGHQLRHRHHDKRLAGLAYKTLMNIRKIRPAFLIVILLVLSFVLGYLSHSQPLLSQPAKDILQHYTFSTRCADPVPSASVRQTILDRVFSGTPPWEGFPPAHASSLLWKEWTKGWGSNAPVFEHLISKVKPKIIIEVGTFLGSSATHMAGLTRKLGLQDSLIVCIDDFRGWPGYHDEEKSMKMVNGDSLLLYQFMQNVAKANATESILFLPFSTSTALRGLCDWGVYGDLIEIDAAHDFHSAWVDINNAYKLLRPGGVLFGHDYAQVGVRNAVHLFAKRNGFRVRRDGKHWILY